MGKFSKYRVRGLFTATAIVAVGLANLPSLQILDEAVQMRWEESARRVDLNAKLERMHTQKGSRMLPDQTSFYVANDTSIRR